MNGAMRQVRVLTPLVPSGPGPAFQNHRKHRYSDRRDQPNDSTTQTGQQAPLSRVRIIYARIDRRSVYSNSA